MIDQTGATPSALDIHNTSERLAKRAELLASIRAYFAEQQVLEVETPLLSQYPVTDPQLDNLRVEHPFANTSSTDQHWLYLSTSPEYAMKQLLSLGSGSIYQIGKAFRQDAPSRLHATEFTMLEWYRLGYDMDDLMADVAALLHSLLRNPLHSLMPDLAIEKISYQDAFLRYADVDPFSTSADELERIARQRIDVSFTQQSKDTWLDLLLTHCVEPNLGQGCMTFLFDYPASQAALARLDVGVSGQSVAKRFELYINGIELANGYHELNDAEEQMRRFEADNQKRLEQGKMESVIDTNLMAALDRGLPDCAGVALGIDRLLLLARVNR